MGKDNITHKLPDGWISATIGDILNLEYGRSLPNKQRKSDGKYPVYGSNGIVGYHNDFLVKGPVIIIGRKGSVGTVHIEKGECWPIDTTYYINALDSINTNFIFYLLRSLNLNRLDSSTAIPGINRNNIYEKKFYYLH
jgi:type I restriction enzyme S subunit